MPLDITTFTLVDKPVTLQEGLKIWNATVTVAATAASTEKPASKTGW